MTNEEFEREFDILYNNIASNTAPSIDLYEKSVFLTQAQEAIVMSIYEGAFEHTEKLRNYIDALVTTKSYEEPDDNVTPTFHLVSPNSRLFQLPENLLEIVYEEFQYTKPNHCGNSPTVSIKPMEHDKFHEGRKSPFQRPNERHGIRLNVGENLVEIIADKQEPIIYTLRYLRKPRPIVLYNRTPEEDYPSDLTVNGVSVYTSCELDSSLHRMILERAVALATATYKQYANAN